MTFKAEVWQTVRSRFNNPPLHPPTHGPGVTKGGACINFKTAALLVDDDFVRETSDKTGVPIDQVNEGIYTHEIGHWMVFPRNLATIILASKIIYDFFKGMPESDQGFIFQTYADMANDTKSVLDSVKGEAILCMRRTSQVTLDDDLNFAVRGVMLAYLELQAKGTTLPDEAGMDEFLDSQLASFGLGPKEFNDSIRPFLAKMLEIDFLNVLPGRNGEKTPEEQVIQLKLNIFRFGNIIKDMIEKFTPQNPTAGQGSKDGKNKPIRVASGLKPDHSDMDPNEIIENSEPKDIRDALRELSGKLSKGEHDSIKEWLKDKGILKQEGGKISIGTSKGELTCDKEVVDYYLDLSRNYPTPITKRSMPTESTREVISGTARWNIGDDPLRVIPSANGGKFLPPLTRMIRTVEKPRLSVEYHEPHTLVVIDSSGSMGDPAHYKSYAALGGVCVARSTIMRGSYVGVVNFSGESFFLPYTLDLEQAATAIVSFQGGGTVLDVDLVRTMLDPVRARMYEEHPEMADKRFMKKELTLKFPNMEELLKPQNINLVMFTDGGIANLDETLEFFASCSQINKGVIVLTDEYYRQQIQESYGDKIAVYHVKDEEDIPKIVIGGVAGMWGVSV